MGNNFYFADQVVTVTQQSSERSHSWRSTQGHASQANFILKHVEVRHELMYYGLLICILADLTL